MTRRFPLTDEEWYALKDTMAPSLGWFDRQMMVADFEDHEYILDAQMLPEEHKNLVCALVPRLMLRHRGSAIVKTLPEPRCKVQSSHIHGNGLFATKDIPKGSYITMYPCDGFEWQPVEWARSPDMCSATYRTGWSGDNELVNASYAQSAVPPKGVSRLAILGNPQLDSDQHFAAHLINDAATCRRPEAEKTYLAVSRARANSYYDGDLHAQISCQDIKAGEEILTSYGAGYWRNIEFLRNNC